MADTNISRRTFLADDTAATMAGSVPFGLRENRRDFLRGSAAVALSAAAGTAVSSGIAGETKKKKPTGRIKKAVKYGMIRGKLSVLDKFKLLKDLGFDGTEIHVNAKIDKHEVLKARDATGVQVHGFLNSSNPDLKHAVEMAKFYGASSVLVVAGRVDQKHPYDLVYRQQQQRIRKALPYAEKMGIKLLVENVWNNFLLSPLEMARFIDELDSPAIGAYFDIGNVARFGWPAHWIRILGKRIGKLDVKGYSRKKQNDEGPWKGFQVEIGEGSIDWPAVRKALDDIGYTSGWATAEVRGGDRKRLADIAQRMDHVLNS